MGTMRPSQPRRPTHHSHRWCMALMMCGASPPAALVHDGPVQPAAMLSHSSVPRWHQQMLRRAATLVSGNARRQEPGCSLTPPPRPPGPNQQHPPHQPRTRGTHPPASPQALALAAAAPQAKEADSTPLSCRAARLGRSVAALARVLGRQAGQPLGERVRHRRHSRRGVVE